jgi:tetraacyldisaccharide 4'-kinase
MASSDTLSSAGGAASSLYTAGAGLSAWLYRRGWRRQGRLAAQTVSIGNLTFGGTGKTPFTIWLADRLSASGLRVSILTRGYHRTSTDRVRVLAAGTEPPEAFRDGDEVQLYLRHLRNVPIGIAARRFQAGRALEDQHPVDLHLLDDGFQHLALARDVDLVLIDASNPWGARSGLSRALRESPSALGRAHAVIFTHCETAAASDAAREQFDALRRTVLHFNPRIPQFLCSTRLKHFTDARSGKSLSVDHATGWSALVFCGLGNPKQFMNMLNHEGIECVATRFFPDHHRYTAEDIQSLNRSARENNANIFLTTEKDLVNLPEPLELSAACCWVANEISVEKEDRFLVWLRERLGSPLEDPRPQNNIAIESASG